MQRAKELLLTTELSVISVGMEVGYDNHRKKVAKSRLQVVEPVVYKISLNCFNDSRGAVGIAVARQEPIGSAFW